MSDVNERIRRELERIEPAGVGFERMLGLVRRRRRNRRLGAGVVGLALTIGVGAGLWLSADRDEAIPLTPSPSPSERVVVTGPTLVLAGDGEAWVVHVDADTARRVEMPELAPGDPPFRIARRGDELVAWSYETLLLDPALESPPRILADDSLIFIPSAADDRVWVGLVDPDAPETARLSAVREMSVDGGVTVQDTRPPHGEWPVAAVNQGLVFQSPEGEGNSLIVWDPLTGDVVDLLQRNLPLAWQGDRLAWCGGDCEVVDVRDFRTGDAFSFGCPAGTHGFDALQGAFSPDGSTLALSLRIDWGPDARRALALLDVETGELDVVDGTNVSAGYNFVAWSADGRSVFITGGTDDREIVEYRPAEGAARPIEVEVGDFYGIAAI